MKNNFLKKKLVIGIAVVFVVIVMLEPIVNGIHIETKSTDSKNIVIEDASSDSEANYVEIREKRVIWDDEGPRIKEVITTHGAPPSSDSMPAYEEVREKMLEHYLEVTKEHREKPVKAIETTDYCFDKGVKPSGLLGSDWDVYMENTNPWPYSWANAANNGKYADIDPQTGVGHAFAPESIVGPGYASCGVENCPEGYGYRWTDHDTKGMIILKDPSKIKGHITNYNAAQVSVSVELREYYNGQKTNSWSDVVYSITGYGGVPINKNLDNLGIGCSGCGIDNIELKNDRLYVISTWTTAFAECGSTPAQIAYAEINPVEFKKIWWCSEKELEYEIEIIKPKEGRIYVRGNEYPRSFPFPFAIMFLCPGVACSAYDGGTGVSKVIFTCDGKSCTDSSSDNGYFSCTIKGVSGLGILTADAYDSNDNKVATCPFSVKILKLGGT